MEWRDAWRICLLLLLLPSISAAWIQVAAVGKLKAGRAAMGSRPGKSCFVCCMNQERQAREISTYEKSSGVTKIIISFLTELVNAVVGRGGELAAEVNTRELSLEELTSGIEGDYRRCYLWTGDIDPSLYDEDCKFTDPTISFEGLRTFQKNLANLRPFIDALVRDYEVDLYSCELKEKNKQVVARWRMTGELALPWRPVIDLIGSTCFRFDPQKGNRIVEYRESWETPASTVLLGLLKPGGRRSR